MKVAAGLGEFVAKQAAQVALGTFHEGRLRVRSEHRGQVDALGVQVLSGQGKAGADTADQQPGQQRRA
jgi:hypothetical protein